MTKKLKTSLTPKFAIGDAFRDVSTLDLGIAKVTGIDMYNQTYIVEWINYPIGMREGSRSFNDKDLRLVTKLEKAMK